MPLQNRVTPLGEIVAIAARGSLMGNRGCLHDGQQRLTRRRWTTHSWVACVLAFKNRRRPLMQPNRYTELFFLDEPTALAAGHRPCGECRRADYLRFMDCFRRGNAMTDADRHAIDRRLQADRIAPRSRAQIRHEASLESLPDGAMILWRDGPHLLWRGALHRWTESGYVQTITLPPHGTVTVLTPRATVAALQAGYRPTPHPSLDRATAGISK
jgi:hypothetical protein